MNTETSTVNGNISGGFRPGETIVTSNYSHLGRSLFLQDASVYPISMGTYACSRVIACNYKIPFINRKTNSLPLSLGRPSARLFKKSQRSFHVSQFCLSRGIKIFKK